MQLANTQLSVLAVLCAVTPAAFGQNDRDYVYDTAGNRISSTNQIRFTGTDAFTVQPERATQGDRVNILGRNFPYAQAPQMAVTFGGVVGTILSVAPNVVTCEVPVGALTGDVVLTLPGGGQVTVATLVIAGISVSPETADVIAGQQVQFTATVEGAANMTAEWFVDEIPGGDATVGTIDATGLYTAPLAVDAAPYPYLVKATNARIQQAAYAVVKPACTNANPIGDEVFELGILSVPGQRDCWEFVATAWETVYVAAIGGGGPNIARLTLRDESGALLAQSGPGSRLKLPNVLLTQDGVYRIEVEAGTSPTGDYQVWVDRFDAYPDGRWMFPGDEFWADSGNWSNSVLPNLVDNVFVADFPGDVVVMANGNFEVNSVLCQESLSLENGELSVASTIQVDGTFSLSGGALADSTVSGGNGIIVEPDSGNALRNVTLNEDLILPTSHARVRLKDLSLNGTLRLQASGASVGFEGDNNWLSGDISFENPTGTTFLSQFSPGNLIIGPGVTVSGGRGNIGGNFWWGQAMTLVVQGTVQANVAGQRILVPATVQHDGGSLEAIGGSELDVQGLTGPLGPVVLSDSGSEMTLAGTGWSNPGNLSAPAGTTLSLGGTWANGGTIDVTSAVLNLGGAYDTAGLGNIDNLAGAVNFTGALDNNGAVLTLDGSAGGLWLVNGGSISGGDVNLTGAANLDFTSNSNSLLENLTVNGDLRFPTSHARVRWNGVQLNGTARLQASGATIGFIGDQTITGDISFENPNGTSYLNMVSDGTLTLAPGIEIRGGRGNLGTAFWWSGLMTFVNQGIVRADVDGQDIDVTRPMTNAGTLVAEFGGHLELHDLGGNLGTAFCDGPSTELNVIGTGWVLDQALTATAGSTMTLDGSWSNTGGITVVDSTVNLCGVVTTAGLGSIVNTNSVVNLCGVLTNTGSTLTLDGGTGSWTMNGGSIVDGTVDLLGGAVLRFASSSNNLLQNTTINGDLFFDVSHARTQWDGAVLNGTAHLAASGATLGFVGNQTWTSGTLSFESPSGNSYLNMVSDGVLTVAGGTVVGGRGVIGTPFWWNGSMTTFVNQVTITSNVSAVDIDLNAPTDNDGTLEVLSGADMDVADLVGGLGTVVLAGAGSDLTVDGTGWTLDLPVAASAGSTLTLNGSWANSGGITVTDSTLNLCGDVSTAGLGSIVNTNSTVNLCANVDNTAATLTLDGGTGSWNLLDGQITGGILDLLSGADLNIGSNSNNRLQDLTVNGDLRFDVSSARTQWSNVTMNGTVHMAASNSTIGFDGNQVIDSGIWSLTGTGTRYFNMVNAGTLTVDSTVTLNAGNLRVGQNFWWSGAMTQFVVDGGVNSAVNNQTVGILAPMVNNGTLNVSGGGNMTVDDLVGNLGVVSIDGVGSDMIVTGTGWTLDQAVLADNGGTFEGDGTWTNTAGITALNGAAVTLEGTWTNGGGVTVTDSTANLNGTITTAVIGTITNTNSTVNLGANVDNTAATLSLDGGTGSWNLLSGQITGGILDLLSGAVLNIGSNSNNRLQDLTVNGDLRFDASSARTQWSNVTMNGTVHMAAANSTIGFDGNQVIDSGIWSLTGTGTRYFNMVNPGTLTVDSSITLNGGNLRVGLNFWWSGAMTQFVVDGTVDSTINNQTVQIFAPMVNNGTLNVSGGGNMTLNDLVGNLGVVTIDGIGSDMIVTGTGWTLDQAVLADNGGSFEGDGSWTNTAGITASTGSSITLEGSWTNPGGVTAIDSTLTVSGAVPTSALGSVSNTNSTVFLAAALDNAAATLTLDGTSGSWTLLGGSITGGTVDLTGGTHLGLGSNTANRLENVTINGDLRADVSSGRVQWDGVILNGTARLATSNATIGFDGDQTITGDISFEQPSGSCYLNMVNAGTLTLASGVTLSGGNGRVGQNFWWSGNMDGFVVDGTVSPGASAGRITFSTPYTQNSGGTLVIEIGGLTPNTQHDQIVINDTASFDGTLALSIISGYTPVLNDAFDVITYSSATGTFTLVGDDVGGGLRLDPTYGATALTLTVVP